MTLSRIKNDALNLGIDDMGGVIASEALHSLGSIPT